MYRRAVCALSLLCASCASLAGDGWLGSHFAPEPWRNALAAQVDNPARLLPELGLLEATAVLATQDHRLQREATQHPSITNGDTKRGDATAAGLAVLATGIGVVDWAHGDDAHALEVLLDSFLATEGLTEGLKYVIGRQRPTKDSKESFPSGHTSFAFNMATFVQRRVADSYDDWRGDLGWLAYVPATYVGINRVEGNRHWPTDVAFGAFLGTFLTNLVYDAHYGVAGRPGFFGVRGLAVEPTAGNGEAGLSMVLRF